MHHIPALEVDIAHLPVLAFLIAGENETALGCPYEDHDLFAHQNLLS
jgi:hypothetical protein